MAEESNVFQGYKERIITSDATDTVVTKVFSGRHARCIKNEFVNNHTLSGQNPLSWPFQALAADDIYNAAQLQNNPDFFPLTAGQSVGGINEREQKASEIVEEIGNTSKRGFGSTNQIILEKYNAHFYVTTL